AGIAAHACLHADLPSADQLAGQATGQAAAVVEKAQAATGPIEAIVGWFMSLF
ncbi:MAG: hypothetical protein QOI63_1998, partial [Thermoplasmata archaeon]|nr:hypothetical protein [Thermoplasmata archaeon]